MEAEVLEDVSEERVVDDTLAILIVVGEALFEIVHDVTWECTRVALGVVSHFSDVNFLFLPLRHYIKFSLFKL